MAIVIFSPFLFCCGRFPGRVERWRDKLVGTSLVVNPQRVVVDAEANYVDAQTQFTAALADLEVVIGIRDLP